MVRVYSEDFHDLMDVKLLRKLEHHALPILTCSDRVEQSVVKVQGHVDENPFTWDLPEPSDQELPFVDD